MNVPVDGANTPPLRVDRDGGVLILTLERSDARNALSLELIDVLHKALVAAADDLSVRAIIIAASGPVFCAGHDLRELSVHRSAPDGGEDFFRRTFKACSAMMQAIIAAPQPVIASVQGMATAAGCQLVATCDLAIASVEAHFATPGVNIGLFCSTPMIAIASAIPKKRALEMLFLGQSVSAVEAANLGLVNRVVAPERLTGETLALAHAIAGKSHVALAIGKRAFYAEAARDLEVAYERASEIMTCNMLDASAVEGIAAFLEKRAAVWPT